VLSDERKRDLLEEAERLVRALRGVEAGRAEVSPVVNVLLLAPGTWNERRTKARAIATMLPTSWLKDRSKAMPRRLPQVREVLLQVLDRHQKEEEVRFLLGWTLRILKGAEDAARAERRRRREGPDHSSHERRA
jgi:hypothetical protein